MEKVFVMHWPTARLGSSCPWWRGRGLLRAHPWPKVANLTNQITFTNQRPRSRISLHFSTQLFGRKKYKSTFFVPLAFFFSKCEESGGESIIQHSLSWHFSWLIYWFSVSIFEIEWICEFFKIGSLYKELSPHKMKSSRKFLFWELFCDLYLK